MSLYSFAQKTTFGAKAGVNTNTFILDQTSAGSDTKYYLKNTGFHVGGIADISFSPNFSLQPQLLLVSKGGKLEISGSSTEFKFLTIDVPINLLYNYNGFFVGAGPNFSYSLSGTAEANGDEYDLYEEELGLEGEFKRFEMGLNGTMGFRFPNGIVLSSNISCGLSNIFEDADGATGSIKANNTFIGFSFGYMFGNNKAKK